MSLPVHTCTSSSPENDEYLCQEGQATAMMPRMPCDAFIIAFNNPYQLKETWLFEPHCGNCMNECINIPTTVYTLERYE